MSCCFAFNTSWCHVSSGNRMTWSKPVRISTNWKHYYLIVTKKNAVPKSKIKSETLLTFVLFTLKKGVIDSKNIENIHFLCVSFTCCVLFFDKDWWYVAPDLSGKTLSNYFLSFGLLGLSPLGVHMVCRAYSNACLRQDVPYVR